MLAKSLISQDIPPLQIGQTGKEAFHLLNDHHVRHVPVVEGKVLVGILSEEDIFNRCLFDAVAADQLDTRGKFFVRENDHLFEVLSVMSRHRLTVIPVIDEGGVYLGLIAQSDILNSFSIFAGVMEAGSVLVLEMNRRDYSMGTIGRILEEEHISILSSFVLNRADAETIQLVLKLNRLDLGRSIALLERNSYVVQETYGAEEDFDGLRNRYQSLMNYLNV